MSLRDAVNPCDQLTYYDCAMRSLCQPTNDLFLGSSVVRACD